MPNIGWTELIVILFVVLLLFGANKLPDLARSMGRSARIFKSEVNEMNNESAQSKQTQTATPSQQALPSSNQAADNAASPLNDPEAHTQARGQ